MFVWFSSKVISERTNTQWNKIHVILCKVIKNKLDLAKNLMCIFSTKFKDEIFKIIILSMKNIAWIHIRIALNLQIIKKNFHHYMLLSLPINTHNIFLHLHMESRVSILPISVKVIVNKIVS
jgi:hypothetical protein